MEAQHGRPEEREGTREGKAAPRQKVRLHPRRRRGSSRQDKYPRLLRFALLLGLPIGLWAAIYWVIRLFG